MGDLLEQVRSICSQLDDSKITARKKAEEQLTYLLNNNSLLARLDNVSKDGTTSDWKWTDVYRTTFGYLKKEVDKIIDDMSKEKKTAVTTRETKKRTAIGLYKQVIRKAKNYLNWSSVLTDLLLMLEQPFMRSSFSEDVVRLMVDAVTNPTSRAMLRVEGPGTDNQWVRIFQSVRTLFSDPPPGLDSLKLCQLLHQTIRQGSKVTCLQEVLSRKDTWKLVKEVLGSDKVARPDSEAKLECVMAANCLVSRMGLDCRDLAIALGEATVQAVIRVWSDKREGGEAVIEFLRMQMVLHHPGGASVPGDGAAYGDRGVWTRQLKRIYLNIIETTIRNRVRYCKQKNSRLVQDYELSRNLVELGVSVVYQLVMSPGQELVGDVTQIVQLDETQGPAKRRRLSNDQEEQVVGLDLLVKELQVAGDGACEETKIPWLQLVSAFVHKHPAVVRGSEDGLVRVMAGMLQSSRSVAVRRLVLDVCRGLLLMGVECQEWKVVGRSAITMLSSNQLGNTGHAFLRTLLDMRLGLVKPDDVYMVYTNRMVKPCKDSMQTLVFMLEQFPVKDLIGEQKGKGGVSRAELVAWLRQEQEQEGAKEHFGPDMAKVLVKLVLKKEVYEHSKIEESIEINNGELEVFEDSLLELVCVKNIVVDSKENIRAETNDIKPVVLPDMVELVQDVFIQEAGEVLDRLNGSLSGKGVETVISLARTLLCYLSGLQSRDQPNITSKLNTLFKHMLSKAGDNTEKVLAKRDTRTGEILSILKHWLSLLKGQYNEDCTNILYSKNTECVSLMTKLEWCVGDICRGKEVSMSATQGSMANNRPSSAKSSRNGTPDPFDDFDDFNSDSIGTGEDADFELIDQADPVKELLEMEVASSCLSVLTILCSPMSEDLLSDALASKQVRVLELVQCLLQTFDYSEAAMDVMITVIQLMVTGAIAKDTVVQATDIMKDMAKNCMTRNKFNYAGILHLCKLLCLLAPAFHQQGDSSCRGVYLMILKGLVSQNYKCELVRLGPDIMVQLVRTVANLGRLGATWAMWSQHNKVAVMDLPSLDMDTDEEQLIARCLPRFLAARPAVLRLEAAQKLLELSSNSKLSLLKAILFPAIKASFQIVPSEEETKQALAGSASALLVSLTAMSPSLGRAVVSCLISLHSNQHLDQNLLARTVQLVAVNNKQDQNTFIQTVLGGLLMDHFDDGGKLNNFPKSLLGYGDDQLDLFVRDNEGVVVPLTLLQSPTDSCLAQLGTMLTKEPADVMKHNFDKLAQLFLPGMASKEFKMELVGKSKMSAMADFIHGKYPGDDFLTLVFKNFPSTIEQLFLNVNDPGALRATFQISKTEKVSSNPPELSAQLPSKIADLLQVDDNENIWQTLVKTRQDSIVKMAVTLTSNLCSSNISTSITDQLRNLHSLYLWLDCIGPSLTDGMLNILPFLAQYICKALLNLNTPQALSDISVTKSSLIVLQKFLNIIIPVQSSSLLPVLFSLHYCLVSLIILETCPEDIVTIVIDILENIFVLNGFRFTSVFSELEDYPRLPVFSALQKSLEKETRVSSSTLLGYIERFMKVASTTDSVFLELPLKTLKSHLKCLSGQLSDLIKSGDLRDLVCVLVKIVKSKIEVVVTQALQCLAELGPIDLESQVLELQISSVSDSTTLVLKNLKDLLLGYDGAVSRNAAQAITKILTYTEEGQKFLNPVDDEPKDVQNLKDLLRPFQKTNPKSCKSKQSSIDEKVFRSQVDNPNMWSQEESHSKWVSALVTKMLSCFHEKTVLSHLVEVCQFSPRMAEIILPFIVHQLLSSDSSDIRLILSAKCSQLFNDHFTNSRAGSLLSQNEKGFPHQRKETILVMLSVVSYLREKSLPDHLKSNLREDNCWENNFWFANLNYLHCAQAAFSCGAYFSAIQMCNIWCLEKGFEIKSGKREDHLEGNIFENIAVEFEREGEIVQDILYQAALNLGDKDAALGAGRHRLVNPATRTAQLVLEGQSGIALPLFDSQALSLDGPGRQGLVSTLYSSGMHFTLSQHLAGEEKKSKGGRIAEFQQECNWRLENWDQFTPAEAIGSFNGCVLGGLESAVRGDHRAVKFWKHSGEKVVATGLRSASLESSAGIYPLLSQLRQLAELELLAGSPLSQETFSASMSQMVARDEASCPDFLLLEPILTQRLLLLSSCKWSGGLLRSTVKASLDKQCLYVSKKARHAKVYWVCNQLQRFYSEVTHTSRLEEAKVAFGQDQKETGIFLAKKLLMDISKDHPTQEMETLLPKVLFNLGDWLHQLKCEPTSKILDTYLVRTVELLEAAENPEDIAELTEAHMSVATFADQQHKQVSEFMDSTEFKERMEAIKRNLKEAEILSQAQKKQKALSTAKVLKERFSNLDTQELELYRTQSEEYLLTALKHYLSVLVHGDKSLAVYRLVSLWFSNSACPSVQELLADKLPSVPSYKFIPLLYQMAARMQVPSQGKQDFSSTLFSLMRRCMQDHPHHAIPIALALANAKEDERQEQGNKASVGGSDDPRTLAALQLVREVEEIPHMKKLVKKYRVLSQALIILAYVTPPAAKMGSGCAIPGDHVLLKISNWSDVAVPTDTLLVRPDRDYSAVCGIGKFSSTYSMVGGVNAPKKLSCTGTDGRLRLQLVKGKDDLRQDAVMEQVFGLMNNLLEQNEETRKRKLKVRTYKVVPLSQRSGILEWCDNTQPIAMYLVGSDNRSGAHKKYFPRQLDSAECRKRMATLNPKNARRVTLKQKEQVFRDVCSNFTPAMKFFFLEKFPSPGSYYLAQSAYTRSVATNSMVGHVLGLGDRHTNNILIDNSTGELVHIDLGVAFEQGKILPTPETIPFRLTRDIVDGFGPAGVEGVFRRCCERSMEVLRDNKSAILTVLEVLVHDPLYNWSVGPEKAAARQEAGLWEELQKETGQGNRMANRALLVLAAKLEGREEGAPLSVQGQVSTLIQKATDPANLCSVFEGWAAWC